MHNLTFFLRVYVFINFPNLIREIYAQQNYGFLLPDSKLTSHHCPLQCIKGRTVDRKRKRRGDIVEVKTVLYCVKDYLRAYLTNIE